MGSENLAKKLFNEALKLSPEERPAYLKAACGGDVELRSRVEELLRGHASTDTVLNSGQDLPTQPDDTPKHSTTADSDFLTEGQFIPGTVLAKRYRIVSLIGKGGMGEVYRADDLRLRQPVALKFLPKKLSSDPARLEALYNEVRQARKVTHPNVCRVHDIGEVDGQHFLSMEFIDGEHLGALLKRIGRLPQGKTIELARQLCDGMGAAHREGLLHRDLKPANLMIDGRGNLRVTDFGLAKLVEDKSGQGRISGTPAYMAPEQLLTGETSIQSDIYAVGLILYEMFTGKALHQATDLLELKELQESNAAPKRPSSVIEGIDESAEEAILQCLEKNPNARPQFVGEISWRFPGVVDPHEAARAARETPSPEMVAAAGEVGTLKPSVGLIWMGLTLAGLIAIGLIMPKIGLLWRIEFPHKPEVLVSKAQEIIAELGIDRPVKDFAYGFEVNQELLDYVSIHGPETNQWDWISEGQLSPIYFWYRQSPESLIPERRIPRVSEVDPPPWLHGDTAVRLSPAGHLLRFHAVPGEISVANDREADAPLRHRTQASEPGWINRGATFFGNTAVDSTFLRFLSVGMAR